MRVWILAAFSAAMAFGQGSPLPITPYQVNDTRNGSTKPCVNCSIYTYTAGTTTPLATYTDSTLGTPLPNPVRTNSAGYAVNGSNAITGIWTGSSCYKIVLKDASAVTFWTQDHVCSPSQISANILALLAASSGSSLVGFIQPETSAVAETVQAKLRQTLSVMDFGAKCDWNGTTGTDDTAAIQAALSAVASGQTLLFPAPCVISSTVYIPQPGDGLAGPTLQGSGLSNSSGLIAKSGSAPFQMLRVYATRLLIQNFTLNGNHVATDCLVSSNGSENTYQGNLTTLCTADGIKIDGTATPTTTTTTQANSGSTSGATVTVVSATPTGTHLGQGACTQLLWEAGTVRQESIAYSSSGNILTQSSGTLTYTHPAGSTIQCYGNNNNVKILQPITVSNGGWGLDIVPATDTNAIIIDNGGFASNVAGGSLLSGAGLKHTGGRYEGNGGPAIQMGDASTGRVVTGSYIGPLADLEGNNPNVVYDICGHLNQIQFSAPTAFTPAPAGISCSSFPAGVPDVGYGFAANPFTSLPELSVKTVYGAVRLEPFNTSGQGSNSGVAFLDVAGNVINFIQGMALHKPAAATTTATASSGSQTITVADATGVATGQFVIATGIPTNDVVTGVSGTTITLALKTSAPLSSTAISFYARGPAGAGAQTNTDYTTPGWSVNDGSGFNSLGLGMRASNQHGFIQAITGSSNAPLELNPLGGAVNINGNAIGGSVSCTAGQHIATVAVSASGVLTATCN